MRYKSQLRTVELLVLSVAFAFASAVSGAAMLAAHGMTEDARALDAAVALARDAAEMVEYHRGDADAALSVVSGVEGPFPGHSLYYDENWNPVSRPGDARYRLSVEPVAMTDDIPMGSAVVSATDLSDGSVLVSLTPSWQEVAGHG